MESGREQGKNGDLANRVFERPAFQLGWTLFLFLFLLLVTEPTRHVLLVWWYYGKDAYQHGMRIIPRKPLRFSNGVLVPQLLDIVSGFAMFFATTFGLSITLFLALRAYERLLGQSPRPE